MNTEKLTEKITEKITEAPVLINALDCSRLIGMCLNSWDGLVNSELAPAALRFGRKRMWRRTEILSWIDAGCPPRSKWEWKKS